jgi:hypothetical protein
MRNSPKPLPSSLRLQRVFLAFIPRSSHFGYEGRKLWDIRRKRIIRADTIEEVTPNGFFTLLFEIDSVG